MSKHPVVLIGRQVLLLTDPVERTLSSPGGRETHINGRTNFNTTPELSKRGHFSLPIALCNMYLLDNDKLKQKHLSIACSNNRVSFCPPVLCTFSICTLKSGNGRKKEKI